LNCCVVEEDDEICNVEEEVLEDFVAEDVVEEVQALDNFS
jgi:hypothetical protein